MKKDYVECFENVKRSPKNQNMTKNGAKEERERSRKITMNKKIELCMGESQN